MVDVCPVCAHPTFHKYLICRDYTVSQREFTLVQCAQCGFVLTQNAPPAAEIGPYYQAASYLSHSDRKEGLFDRLYHWARARMLHTKRKLVQKVTGKKTGRLLDVGSGTGYFLHTMQAAGWEVAGIEANEAARASTQRKFGLAVQAPEALPQLPPEGYHAITLWHVLEHVHDLNGYLQQLYRLLHPKGALVIAVPNHQSLDAQHYGPHWAGYDVPRHLWHFAPATLERLLARHGFALLTRQTMPFDPLYVALLSEKYRQSPLGLLRGLFWGGLSLLTGFWQVKRSSSVIYVFLKD
jgi:ubiquinone/menaquinone biosynthesis C-methylase UbiE